MNKFSVDKKKSLGIITDILFNLKKENDISYNEKCDFCDDNEYNIIPEKHKIKIAEISLDNYDIDNFEIEFLNAIKEENYNISDEIEIYYGSKIEDGKILLTAFLHDTQADSDISYPVFTYNEIYKCWIIKDNFWGAKGGICCNGIVTILDFSEYTLK